MCAPYGQWLCSSSHLIFLFPCQIVHVVLQWFFGVREGELPVLSLLVAHHRGHLVSSILVWELHLFAGSNVGRSGLAAFLYILALSVHFPGVCYDV